MRMKNTIILALSLLWAIPAMAESSAEVGHEIRALRLRVKLANARIRCLKTVRQAFKSAERTKPGRWRDKALDRARLAQRACPATQTLLATVHQSQIQGLLPPPTSPYVPRPRPRPGHPFNPIGRPSERATVRARVHLKVALNTQNAQTRTCAKLLYRSTAQLKTCYKRSLNLNPNVAGKLSFDIKWQRQQRAVVGKKVVSSLGTPQLQACVIRQVSRPCPQDASARVTLVFTRD